MNDRQFKMFVRARSPKVKILFLKSLKLKQSKPLKKLKLSLKLMAKRLFILQTIDNIVYFKMAALDEEEANLIQIALDIQYRQRQQLATDSCTSK